MKDEKMGEEICVIGICKLFKTQKTYMRKPGNIFYITIAPGNYGDEQNVKL